MAKYTITIYEKNVNKSDGSGKFPVKKVSVVKEEEQLNGDVKRDIKTFALVCKKECKEKLEKTMIKNDLHFPVLVDCTADNYFFGLSNPDANGRQYETFVLLDFNKLTQTEFENKKKTIEDLF